jgi:hypothetical protein
MVKPQGNRWREWRAAAGLSLCEFADRDQKAPRFLSEIELRRPPADQGLARLRETGRARLVARKLATEFSNHPRNPQVRRAAVCAPGSKRICRRFLLPLPTGVFLAGAAHAQSACGQLGVKCGHASTSMGSSYRGARSNVPQAPVLAPRGQSQIMVPTYRRTRTSNHLRRVAIMAAALLGFTVLASAQQIPALTPLPATVAASTPDLISRRATLMQERATLHGKIDSLNAQCGAVAEGSATEASCHKNQAVLLDALNSHIQQSQNFNVAAEAAIAASPHPPKPVPGADAESIRIIKGMNALAKQLGWSANKRARLDKALNALRLDGDLNAAGVQISRTWSDITARGMDAALIREASRGGGMGFPGAGRQTDYNDCAIFALANASGLPYGVVAARATELIRQGQWRTVDERASPQAVIENHGVMAGEVVMLAEVFGRAEVLPSADFAKTLTELRPVMVNVVPENGDGRLGHEVVLTKTFQHDGETWYVMMDSHQDAQQFLFLSARELHTILQENGVTYRPNPETTPRLLRNRT